MDRALSSESFFDITNFAFKDIFEGVTYPWEVLPKILPFIEQKLKSGELKTNYQGRKDVYIGEGTIIQPNVEIVGPALIGKNSFIGHASLLRDGVIIGNNVHIGHAIEAKHSVFLNGATAAHLNYIGDSVVGNNANISGGAILANLRLDKKPVVIKQKDMKIETHLAKFSSIIGDNSTIGVNAVLNPGTVLGKNTKVYPLVSVVGVHKDEESIR